MFRIIFACVLATLAVCGHAADSFIYYSPTGVVLQPGKYTRVTVTWNNGQAVISEQVVVLDIGGSPVPPPPIDTVTTKIQGYIAAVTADQDKVKTSAGLAMAYGQVLLLTEEAKMRDAGLLKQLPSEALMALAQAGAIKDVVILRKVAETIVDQVLASPQVMKTATWKPFTEGMKTLAAPMDFAGVVNAYTVAKGLLGGGPVPPPPPPPPPIPITGLHILVIHDPLTNGNLPQTQVDVFSSKAIRDWMAANCELDKAKTRAFRFLSPNQDLSKEVDSVWAQLAAHGASSGVADPYWILSSTGRTVVEAVPVTIDAALARLKEFKSGN